MRKPKTLKQLSAVWEKLIETSKHSKESISQISIAFNAMLDELRSDDFFGTEGQNDPRGDDRS